LHYQKLRCSGLLTLFSLLQLTALLSYLIANIVNVGEMGTALPVLVTYIGLSVLVLVLLWIQKKIYIRSHFFIFLLLIIWIAFRIVVDLSDIEYLKKITMATTGGMLLFYMMGCFLSITYHDIVMCTNRAKLAKIVLILFFCLLIWMLNSFLQRLHPRLFYLMDVDGAYQRSGNFLSISFVSISFFYFLFSSKWAGLKSNLLNISFWSVIYTTSALIALVSSQLFGSNSATGVILGVYLITFVMALLVPRKILWKNYVNKKLALPWSKLLTKRLAFMAIFGALIFSGLLVSIVVVTGFDIYSIRLLGFGSDSNSLLMSRIEILINHGLTQLGYAPFFGNINVAYLTTGDSGRYLHSFFPYVMSNLGLVGLGIVLALFVSIFIQLYRESKKKGDGEILCYQYNMVAIYSIFVVVFLIFFANLTTSVSWVVLWFSIGFASKPLSFRRHSSCLPL